MNSKKIATGFAIFAALLYARYEAGQKPVLPHIVIGGGGSAVGEDV